MKGLQQRRALLGRLAGLGWFVRHGEVASTQALAMLLEDPQLRDALLTQLRQLTGTDLGSVESFQAELIHGDQGRPDLEGQDNVGRPLVVVEAKFSAELGPRQVEPYLADQKARLGEVPGALVLLVPAHRRREANAVLRSVRSAQASEKNTPTTSVSGAVVTWDEWLDLWDEAARQLPEPERGPVVGDLVQLRELCATLAGLDIQSLGSAVVGIDWRDRRADLYRLVDQVTALFSDESINLLPTGTEHSLEFFRRYISGGYPDTWCAVGVVGAFADAGNTPFWLRYHKKTSGFPDIRERVMASPFAVEVRSDEEHVWLPLHVSADLSGTAIVAELALQIEAIRAVAADAQPPQPGRS